MCIYGSVDSIGMAFLVGLKLKREREREYWNRKLCVVWSLSKRKLCLRCGGLWGWQLIMLSLLGDNDHD